ncbi:hypothetical protein [Streptomyces sp. URMC 129]|uniref:hypothetical protein n=1 Tax=Streptomyces sp. URMC 129 TaxID=3423407 RepID=UPI003F1C376C
MLQDAAHLTQELTPYVTAAIGAYGTAVLTRVGEDNADVGLSFGRRVLRRLTGRADSDGGEEEPTADQDALVRTVGELARVPDDRDVQGMLRVQIRRLLTDHPDLAAEIAGWPRPQAPGPVTITASGPGSVALHTNYGTIHTGDTTPGPRP